MANCFHTALEMPTCRNNSEDTTDAKSNTAPESNSEAKKVIILDKVIAKRNVIYAISCVLAVCLDPLFLYIPILNDDMKCIGIDKNLKIVALVLRSLTDLIHIVKIICQPWKSREIRESYMMLIDCGVLKRLGFRTKKTIVRLLLLVVDILTVLPIPQVVIIFSFTKMSGSVSNTIIMNSLVVFQYVPRVFCIYRACKDCDTSLGGKRELWLKGGLYFFLYILASNVFGAFWYFFSIQRMIYCWQSACRTQSDHNKCKTSAFECHGQPTIRNTTLTYDLCPINPQNATVFDFGIFINVLQPGIAGSTNFAQKLTNCLLWALRNLSSFGSNLQPSINTWENVFATSVSIIGLLLFLYLIGNLQTYMSPVTMRIQSELETIIKISFERQERTRNHERRTREVEEKEKLFEQKIESWLHKNGLEPNLFKSKVMAEVVNLALKRNTDDVDENEIFQILSRDLQDQINNERNGWEPTMLRKVRLLQNMNDQELKRISKKLIPQSYEKSRTIIKEKESLKMIFIVHGVASIEKRYCLTRWELKAGEFYGEELQYRPSAQATESVKAKTDVQALILEADALQSLISEYKLHISKEITVSSKYEINHLSMLKNVPKLETYDENFLKAISEVLVQQDYVKGSQIVKENDKLDKMFLVTRGTVGVQKSCKKRRELYKVGALYGEELLRWALVVYDMGTAPSLPLSVGTATADTKVDVLILYATDLEKKMMDLAAPPPLIDSESED